MTIIDIVAVARAEALFVSDLSTASQPTRAQADAVIRRAVRCYGGTRGCAGEVAAAYGQYPEAAAARMRWALGATRRAYPSPAGRRPRPRYAGCT
jgi:hypothetical protein